MEKNIEVLKNYSKKLQTTDTRLGRQAAECKPIRNKGVDGTMERLGLLPGMHVTYLSELTSPALKRTREAAGPRYIVLHTEVKFGAKKWISTHWGMYGLVARRPDFHAFLYLPEEFIVENS